MIFLLDNYDSFTYNLVDYCHRAGAKVTVKRNDKISVAAIAALKPKGIILSPGPEIPESAGILMELVDYFSGKIPMLGICLGHQAIGQHLGLKLVKAPEPVHGKVSVCQHEGHWLFKKIPKNYKAMRYHSLILKEATIEGLNIISKTKADGLIMAMHHAPLQLTGIQYHPESILTPFGVTILSNWLNSITELK